MINEDLFERIVNILLEIAQTPEEWARARDAGSEERRTHREMGKPKRTQSYLLKRKAAIQKAIVNRPDPGTPGAPGAEGKHVKAFRENPSKLLFKRGFGNLKR